MKLTDVSRCLNDEGERTDGQNKCYTGRRPQNPDNLLLVASPGPRTTEDTCRSWVNTGFSNTASDDTVKKLMPRCTSQPQPKQLNNLNVYYRNTCTPLYKQDEKDVREIVADTCTPTDNDHKL